MKNYVRTWVCSLLALAAISTTGCAQSAPQQKGADAGSNTLPKVYMFKEITPENLVKIYKALGREATGKVAVKLSTGEPGGHNFLQPALIKDLVQLVDGTIVECNTAYGGGRSDTQKHLQAAEDHGFTAIAPVDIMDAEGEVRLPVKGGKHISYDIVGSHYPGYDFTVVLSHFKGHAMAGFGGALKNISIGIASANGKRWIHSGGTSTDSWGNPSQEEWLETMAEAAKAVIDHCGEHIIYKCSQQPFRRLRLRLFPRRPENGGHRHFGLPRSGCLGQGLYRPGSFVRRPRQNPSDRTHRLA